MTIDPDKRRIIFAVTAGLIILAFLAVVIYRSPFRRRARLRVPTAAVTQVPSAARLLTLPVDQWTSYLLQQQAAQAWERLDDELEELRTAKRPEYERFRLAYLHGRVKSEAGAYDDAIELFTPLFADAEYRPLALFHASEAADADGEAEQALAFRERLVTEAWSSPYRPEALEALIDGLVEEEEWGRLRTLVTRISARADSTTRRVLEAALVAADLDQNNIAAAVARAIRLAERNQADDAADRVFRLLNQRKLLSNLPPERQALFGEVARAHRHYDAAIPLLESSRRRLPKKWADLTFSIGRSHFGAERFADARQVYLEGAAKAQKPAERATFFFHASRASQLLGDDRTGEVYLTRAIAEKGKFPATSAALTQRARTRARQGRLADASSDLALLRRLSPNDKGIGEATVAVAVAAFSRGDFATATRLLDTVRGLRPSDDLTAEVTYWKARIAERNDPADALTLHLRVMRSDTPTHFAYFSRRRAATVLASAAQERRLSIQKKLQQARDAGDTDAARAAATDLVLLATQQSLESDLAALRSTYLKSETYAAITSLAPAALPSLPVEPDDQGRLLAAIGLFDDAADWIEENYSLRTPSQALARSYALHLGGMSRRSIYAAEVLMRQVPDDFVPALLPDLLQQMLYPRYFYEEIVEDADRYDADPRLILSIMREESRFNPRAKSFAAARGLLQFIITTARDVGASIGIVELSPEDLYDPRTIIRLGAKYVGDLMEQFEGNPYSVASAYNAGPYQTRLWSRLTPTADNDAFLSSVNFEETKHYIRKVLNSYERYGEIYGRETPVGGLRAEP